METFDASLRAIGDVKALPAKVGLADGQLSLAAGDTELGTWAINEIEFESIPNGYRMSVEGDQIVVELKNVDAFTEALDQGRKRRGRRRKTSVRKSKRAESVAAQPSPAREPTPPSPPSPSREVARPPVDQPGVRSKERPERQGLIDRLDRSLVKAQKRFGPYLPDWVFTRFMFGVLVSALILMVVLPGFISVILLVGGLLLVLFGAVVYTDPMLASRLLPGRTAPQHALLFGVLTLMVGVLLGVIAR
ncbi:MAG: hypothetical protein PVG83_06340 [Acidimicrobiia bacterium]|jgi:hypothetical protein